MLKAEINGNELVVDKATPGQFGNVLVRAEGLTGRCRVRVAPVLPYAMDFEKVPVNRTPAGWVNAMTKFAVQQEDGKHVLVKNAMVASPLVARAYAYIGLPSLTDYTIQADVKGAKVNEDMPDAGVVANRYLLMLDGNKQTLRLVSWDALPRVDKTIGWPWKPNTWYTLKLTVDVQEGKATVRGKAWPTDQSEPKDWTLEFVDPIPNREGSPALYGYATGILEGQKGAEAFYDNVRVTPNSRKETKAPPK
jgi:hypothetical protein